MRYLTIIVADDNHVFRKILCDFLESFGRVKVIAEAVDGDHVIQLVRQLRPDIVLMDISMPNKTGLEAAKIIKSKYPDISIVVITLHDGALYRQLAKDCMADEFISKNDMKKQLSELLIKRLQTDPYDA